MSGVAQAVAVAGGAAMGALLRWRVGVWLNTAWPGFALGTLAVNVAGGLLIGLALAAMARLPQEWPRLLVMTGFLGGLPTFSAFSAESLGLLQRQAWGLAAAHTLAHVVGALAAAALGHALGQRLVGA